MGVSVAWHVDAARIQHAGWDNVSLAMPLLTSAPVERRLSSQKERNAALFQAVIQGHSDAVIYWLDSGADINTEYDKPSLRKRFKDWLWDMKFIGAHGDRPLHKAVQHGHLAVIDLLLARGADVNAPGVYGWPPLVTAMFYGRYDAMGMLLRARAERTTDQVACRADVNLAFGEQKFTALHYASSIIEKNQ